MHYFDDNMQAIVPNEPKTGTLQIRINPDYKAQAEALFSDCGMSLTDAINIFIQMSLRVGGLPFMVNRDPGIVLSNKAADYLESEFRKGAESSKNESDWISLEKMKSKYESDT